MTYTRPARIEILHTMHSPYKTWACHVTNAGVMLENTKTGYTDWTLQYKDHAMAYDRPERIPPYAKKLARQAWAWLHRNPLVSEWYTKCFLSIHPDAKRGA